MSKKRKYKQGINVNHRFNTAVGEESEVVIADYKNDDGTRQIVRIHPWDRSKYNKQVYVEVGYVDKSGYEAPAGKKYGKPEGWTQAFIVERADFVEAILAVFPELKRVDS